MAAFVEGRFMSHSLTLSLVQDHIRTPGLYANRDLMIAALTAEHGLTNKTVCELGVMFGNFTEFLLKTMKPKTFYAVDVFRAHEEPVIWGHPPSHYLGDKTHRQFYESRFANSGVDMRIIEGLSSEAMPKVPDKSCDLVYVDAGHLYEDVRGDALEAQRAVKDGGIIIFNDYTYSDPIYGVVRAVNEMLYQTDWKIIGFAFHRDMFCDIALKRFPS
jgi:hypothetical protein